MKTTIRFSIASTLIFMILAGLNQCKSPVARETQVPVSSDTTAVMGSGKTTTAVDTAAKQRPLTVTINNLASATSPVYVSLYNIKNKFLSKTDHIKEYKFTPNSKILTALINDVSYGEFAIATYQDVNLDGKCNTNLIGIPKEPYGFSNNYRPTIKAPRFKDCQFAYNATTNTLTIAMIR